MGRLAAFVSQNARQAAGTPGRHSGVATREAGLGDRYLDAEGVGAFLGYSYTYVRDKIVHAPDFPTPLRMGDGHRRWLKSDVSRWAKERTRRSA